MFSGFWNSFPSLFVKHNSTVSAHQKRSEYLCTFIKWTGCSTLRLTGPTTTRRGRIPLVAATWTSPPVRRREDDKRCWSGNAWHHVCHQKLAECRHCSGNYPEEWEKTASNTREIYILKSKPLQRSKKSLELNSQGRHEGANKKLLDNVIQP